MTPVITAAGKVEGGKAKAHDITIQDGRETHNYSDVEQVPERYRDKVRSLVEMSEKGQMRIEIKQ